MNGRRKFLLQMGAVGGALVIPSCVSNTINRKLCGGEGKKDAIKVKVVFTGCLKDVQETPDWPNVGYDFRPDMISMVRQLNAGVPDVEFIPDKAETEEDGADLVLRDRQEGADIAGYMVIMLNPWQRALVGIVKSGRPVLSTPLPYAGDGGWLVYNSSLSAEPNYSFIASLDFKDVVRAAGAFSVLRNGSAADFKKKADRIITDIIPKECSVKPKEDHVECLAPEEVLEKCRGMKILSVAGVDQETAGRVRECFGMEVINVSYDEINAAAAGADEARAAATAEKWKSNAANIYDVSDDEIFGSAKVYVGMKDLLARYGARCITVACLDACYGGHIKHYPCLGFMELQNEGLLGVCENDLTAVVSLIVGNIMTKGQRIGYLSDPVLDYSHRAVIYAHCVCTTKFFGVEGPSSRYEVLTHSEDRNGAAVRTIAPIGYPVTTFQFMFRDRKVMIHKGVIMGNSGDDRACRTKIIAEVTGDYSRTPLNWTGWHRTTFIGDISREIVAFAEKIGFEIVWQS